MALSSILKTSFLLVSTLAVCSRSSYCTKSFPDRLHCASTLYFRENPTSDLKYYNIDEYVNLKEGRSSLAVEDTKIAETKIYYNQASPAGYGGRKFLQYNPEDWTCRSQVIGDWLFAKIRRVAIHLCDLENLKRDLVDVPIGPSVMLFAVENNAPKFKYVTSIFSKTRLSNVEVYSHSVNYYTSDGSRNLLLIVHVPIRWNLKQDVSYGHTIENYLGDMADGTANMWMIGACLQSNPSTINGHYLDNTKLDEDNFCEQKDIMFVIRYNIISKFRPGSLVGSSLVELNREFDFHREPFVQPIGIGCWGSSNDEIGDDDSDSSKPEVAPFWERSISKLVVSQMSAQFVTTQGPRSVSFVAYDKKRHLLRLDQSGRKNVYDLLKRRSYHVGEFAQMSGPSETYISDESDGSLREKCVVFDIDQEVESDPGGSGTTTKDKQIVWASLLGGGGQVDEESSGSILERLLGLHHSENREHHLGTRTIDHVAYEVYESEIMYKTWSDVPILLRSNKFTGFPLDGKLESERQKFYATFYVRFEGLAKDREPLMLLKFVELWSFNPVKRIRSIVNHVIFLDFSWSLDVEPTSDSQSERTEANLGLFDVPTCQRSRASQARLVVNYKRVVEEHEAAYQLSQEQQVAILKANEQTLVERLNQMLADNLEVSRLNLVDLQVQIEPRPNGSVDLISVNRVVELRQGLLQLNRLGLVYMNARSSWRDQIKRVQVSRFSLQDCQLDSIAWPQGQHWFAHCPAASICLILAPGGEVENSLKSANDKVRDETKAKSDSAWQRQWQNAEDGIECTVYSMMYSTVDEADSTGISVLRSSALAQTETNAWLLPHLKLELKLDYRDSRGTWRKFNYKAVPFMRKIVPLDPIGARLTNQLAVLKDLRHTTRDEEANTGVNMNQRVRLAAPGASQTSKLDPFRHCQLACQLDDLCASFSFCPIVKSNPKRQQPDCVLSSLRLTADRVGLLIELGHASKKLNPAGADSTLPKNTYQLNATSEYESQSFLMQLDEGCGMHPRDFLVDYKVVKSVAHSGGSSKKKLDTEQAQSKEQAFSSQTLSLDDCAGLSFERNLYQDPKQTNFTYCPMESLCLVGGSAQQMLAQSPEESHCFIYAKRVSKAYERSILTHMSIQNKNSDNKEKDPRTTKKMSALNPKDLAHEMTEVHNVAKKLWGLSEETCARECNLHKSSCFAFDSCRQVGRVLCILYSIRSPRSSQGAYLPWTGREKQLQETKDVSLISSLLCNHYSLKRGYFEVRLSQVLNDEASAALDQDYGGQLPPDKRKYVESLISTSDQERSKLELRAMQQEDKQMSQDLAQQMAQLARSSSIHFLFLLLGLGVGCVGALYKDQLMSSLVRGSERLVDSVRQFRQRNANDDLNELVPEDQL